MFNPIKYFRNSKIGLALGSGGAKGLAHIAVIEYLASMGIPIDMIAGSSIGAVIGALYCYGNMSKFKEDIQKFTLRELISFMDPMIPRSGLIEGKGFVKFMERYIPRNVKMEDLKPPLAVLATDFMSGSSVIFRTGCVLDALRASVSIPGVLVPVRHRSTLLVDGGVANPLPVNVVRDMGAGIIVAVNLHPQLKKRGLRQYVKSSIAVQGKHLDSSEIEQVKSGENLEIPSRARDNMSWLKSVESWIRPRAKVAGQAQDPTPNIFEIIAQAFDIMEYVNTALLLKYNSPAVLIEPDIIDVNTLDFADARRIIAEGNAACDRVRKQLIRRVRAWV